MIGRMSIKISINKKGVAYMTMQLPNLAKVRRKYHANDERAI